MQGVRHQQDALDAGLLQQAGAIQCVFGGVVRAPFFPAYRHLETFAQGAPHQHGFGFFAAARTATAHQDG